MRRSRIVYVLIVSPVLLSGKKSCSAYLFTGCCCRTKTQRENASRGSSVKTPQLGLVSSKNRWNQLFEGRQHRTRAAATAGELPSEGAEEASLRKGLPGYTEDWQLREALGQCGLDVLADVPADKIAGSARDKAAAGSGAATRSD